MSAAWDHGAIESVGERLRGVRGSLSDGPAFRNALEVLTAVLPESVDTLRRMAVLREIAECLDDGQAEELMAFLEGALETLEQGLENDSVPGAAERIMRESSERWGEYLGLLEGGEPEEIPEPVDEEPTIDAGALLRLIAGASAPDLGPPAISLIQGGEPDRRPPGRMTDYRDNSVSAPPLAKEGAGAVHIAPLHCVVPPDLDPELREVFLADATDLFERIQALTLDLNGGRPVADVLRELGRCFHTLKGAAGSIGLTDLSARVHDLEDRLGEARNVLSTDLKEQLERALRDLENTLAALRGGAKVADAPRSETPPPPPDGDGPIRISADRLDELMDVASELLGRREFWKAQADVVTQCAATTRACGLRLRASADRLRRLGNGTAPELEEILRALEEQAEDLALVAESARATSLPLADEGELQARASLRLWETLQSVRIAPVRGLFHRLARVAHEAARVEGRAVEVVMRGEEHGLDRSAQERAFEPLLHVVRNAVAHGLEPPEERLRAGKPATGRVTLEARREGNAVVLAVEDDGRGLDYRAIEAKGRALGLLDAEEAPNITRLNALIFQPGFSTRAQANAIAGRGVGMDVVAQEVAKLRGTFELTSRQGHGTRLEVRLPARLALEQAMVLRVAGQLFALPLEVVESVQGADDEVAGTTIEMRVALGLGGAAPTAGARLLIVRAEGKRFVILVESLEGVRELVVKPLGPLLEGHPLLCGTSLTTAGEVVLRLDPGTLVRTSTELKAVAEVEEDAPRHVALVVDDSPSVRRVAVRNLRNLGLEVDEVGDGLEALGRLRRKSYRLVLTDLEMPRMDGFELLAELDRSGLLGTTPLVVSSTRSDPETRRRALELGARAVLPKPVDADALEQVVVPLL
jgi:chemotaxis protein histidine kinase CheA